MMTRRLRSAVVLSALLGVTPMVFANPPAGKKPVVESHGGLLSVDFKATPAAEAFRALAEKADVHITAPEAVLARPLTLEFKNLKIDDAMRQIVRHMAVAGYAVVYDQAKGGKPTYVLMEHGPNLPAVPGEAAAEPKATPVVPFANAPQVNPTISALKAEERAERKRQHEEERRSHRERREAERAARRAAPPEPFVVSPPAPPPPPPPPGHKAVPADENDD